ncbi:MAG: hypothetical protein NC548_46240 [Lachnospiraceae bacterium]|nr:hypothetical protein [Lachnospiraceae bacterium]
MANDNPILICHVSTSPFSLARHYGGVRIYGTMYCYKTERDILVREDWSKVYAKVDWKTFCDAVRNGVKPEIPKKVNPKQVIEDNTKSLFD